ncbi:MAG: TetR/AcrR family transcriptional regulator, ethionamide resistance regulator [Solirubrobacteraceae bacterium]|nr:TetR/AcrR family transcriptional regulator, ethionamide resistance regulator [Solirubrobacteraceae bacterium]
MRERSPMRFRTAGRRSGAGADPREALLSAADRLLEDRRLEDLTVVDVIGEAGVSRATFYLYFESKHALVAAAGARVTREIDAVWTAWFSGSEPVTYAILLDHMRRSVALWREHRPVLVAIASGWRQDASAYPAWGALMSRYVEDVQEFIERAHAAGMARPQAHPATLAPALVWGNENSLYLSLTGTVPAFDDDEQLARTMATVWWSAIFLEPPG